MPTNKEVAVFSQSICFQERTDAIAWIVVQDDDGSSLYFNEDEAHAWAADCIQHGVGAEVFPLFNATGALEQLRKAASVADNLFARTRLASGRAKR